MPKPNRDQVKVSHYISREGVAQIGGVQEAEKLPSWNEAHRLLLRLGLQAYRKGQR